MCFDVSSSSSMFHVSKNPSFLLLKCSIAWIDHDLFSQLFPAPAFTNKGTSMHVYFYGLTVSSVLGKSFGVE